MPVAADFSLDRSSPQVHPHTDTVTVTASRYAGSVYASTEKYAVNELFSKLDLLRRERGISLKKMGEICGITPQGVQTWKRSKSIPMEHMKKLAAYFGVSLDTLAENNFSRGSRVVREPEAGYGNQSGACRYPADCNLPERLSAIESELSDVRKLLVSLLAEERAKSGLDQREKAV